MSKLHTLYGEYKQSVWLDYIDRNLLIHGGLGELVGAGVRGVTSNPTIFHKAITTTTEYDDAILDLLQADHNIDEETLYQWLIVNDIQKAADILKPVYKSSEGTDGFVSLEVSPHLAYDTNASIEAARHLWRSVDRPNLMIKIPGTVPGLLAVEELIAEGINVNITLLFSVERYKAVTDAFIKGLSRNPNPEPIASVASFFVSRVDSKVDEKLAEIGTEEAKALRGKIAIANAKMAYQHFKSTLDSAEYKQQVSRGAKPQRPLWASTGTKNPEYSDVLYVEELIGESTVNTVTPETLEAFESHGEPGLTIERNLDVASDNLNSLDRLHVDLEQITQELEQEGVKKFAESYDQLFDALREKIASVSKKYAGS